MKEIFYQSVSQRTSSEGFDIENPEKTWQLQPQHRSLIWQKAVSWILYMIVLISLATNAFFAYERYIVPWELAVKLPTKFAGLTYEVPKEIFAHTNYDSTNRTIQDEAWEDPDLKAWSLFIALDDEYANSMGIPISQRWPWDINKGSYIPLGGHQLHCTHVLRAYINEAHDGVPEENHSWPYYHAMHCLNIMRSHVMCHADDTPLYTGRIHKNAVEDEPRAGIGSYTMCRDWSKLTAWTREHSACYKPIRWLESDVDELERYKFCPDGSEPWKSN